MDIVVGFLIAWAAGKARRVGRTVDGLTDAALDAAAERVWAAVAAKLGADPVIRELVAEAEQTGQAAENVQAAAVRVLEQAASADPAFSAALRDARTVEQTTQVSPSTVAVSHGGAVGNLVTAPVTAGGSVTFKNKTVTKAVQSARAHPVAAAVVAIAVVAVLMVVVLALAQPGPPRSARIIDFEPSRAAGTAGRSTSPTSTMSYAPNLRTGILVSYPSGERNGIATRQTIGFLNPDTGEFRAVREFNVDGWQGELNIELALAPNLDRVAITKMVGGMRHAGWVDVDGRFTDVNPQEKPDPFGEPHGFNAIGFGRNGDFYYERINDDLLHNIYRLAAGATSGAVMIGTNGPHALGRAWRYNDGSIAIDGTMGREKDKDANCLGLLHAAWLSPSTYVEASGAQLIRVTTDDPYCGKGDQTTLLPSDNVAEVSDPVAAPDSSRVAFTYQHSDLYYVAATGGRPVKIDYPKTTLKNFHLLRWM
ncbi:MAG: hypothetical protein HOQ24_05340 [Mycobacteriaceae bacterium]|nr:hypothetical protein [Mycobacteriaceae bacterium]